MVTGASWKMTDEQKNAQIGDAVEKYQAAKAECGQLDQKIKLVIHAYRQAGASMDSRQDHWEGGEPKIVKGVLQTPFGLSSLSDPNLLNTAELLALFTARDNARTELDRAKQTMNSLGVTGIS
jgi:hypothetical protein